MSEILYDSVVKTTDGELVAACLRIVRDERAKLVRKLVLHPVTGSAIELTPEQWESDQDLSTYTGRAGRALRSVSLQSGQNQSIASVSRGLTDRNRSKELYDDLTIQCNQFSGSGEEFLDFVAVVQTELRSARSSDLGQVLGPDVAKHFASRDEALSRLEAMLADATSNLVAQRGELDRDFQARREALETELAERDDASRKQAAAREEALAVKQQELESLRQEIDDRSSTHARRDDRKELLEALSEENRLALSPVTSARRQSVLIAYGGLLAFLAVSLALTWCVKTSTPVGEYLVMGTKVALGVGLVFTAGFLIRWLNSFASKSAAEDFKLKQLQLDVQRASWLVELYFESLSSGDKEGFPEELMQRLSTGLFESEQLETESVTASDALASALLGTAGKLRLNMAGNEMELSKRAISKLGKIRVPDEG